LLLSQTLECVNIALPTHYFHTEYGITFKGKIFAVLIIMQLTMKDFSPQIIFVLMLFYLTEALHQKNLLGVYEVKFLVTHFIDYVDYRIIITINNIKYY